MHPPHTHTITIIIASHPLRPPPAPAFPASNARTTTPITPTPRWALAAGQIAHSHPSGLPPPPPPRPPCFARPNPPGALRAGLPRRSRAGRGEERRFGEGARPRHHQPPLPPRPGHFRAALSLLPADLRGPGRPCPGRSRAPGCCPAPGRGTGAPRTHLAVSGGDEPNPAGSMEPLVRRRRLMSQSGRG